jgi:secreted trypsin-like serine protease
VGIARRSRIVVATLGFTVFAALGIFAESSANAVEGGSVASTAQFPWVVAVKPPLLPVSFCGGTLVAPTKVLTAGHCVDQFLAVPSLLHVVGGRDDMRSHNGVDVAVSRIWREPGFSTFTFDGETGYRNDVAVLTLSRPLPFATLPIAAPGQNDLYQPNTAARLLGWGTTGEKKLDGGILRSAPTAVVADGQCASSASYGSTYDAGQDVCAGDFALGGVDTCEFDSGTPLVIRGVVAGVTSWGVGCGRPHFPGLYVRVATFSTEISAQLTS